MSDNVEQKSDNNLDQINILTKTQNVQLNHGWIYDCIFSKIREGINTSNKPELEEGQMNGHHQDLHQNKDGPNEQENKCRVIACSRQGKLIEFEKLNDGTILNTQVIFSGDQGAANEEFHRLFEDCDSVDYQNRFLLVSGSKKKIHVMKLEKLNFQLNDQDGNQEEYQFIKKYEYIPFPDKNVVGMCGFKKHSNKIFSIGSNNITLFDLQHGKASRRIKSIENGASVEFSRQFNVFSICGLSRDIYVFDDRQYKHIFSLRGHTNYIPRLTSLKENNQFFLCSGSHDQSIILWDIRYQQNNQIIQNHHSNAIFGLDYDQDNQIVYSTGWDKAVKAFDLKTLTTVGEIQRAQSNYMIQCKYNSSTNEVITSSRDGSIQFYTSSI